MTEIVLNVWFIQRERTSPDQSVRESAAVNLRIIAVHPPQPVQILTVVEVGDLCLIHIKGGNGYPARRVVPVKHYILINPPHGKGTTFNQHQVRTGDLLRSLSYRVTQVIDIARFGIPVAPASSWRHIILSGSLAGKKEESNNYKNR